MLRRSIISLFLLVSFGSMQAMTVLHDVDASLLGQPQHQVVVFEGSHRTVYSAYPKETLATLEQRKLLTQCATAFTTTSFLYTGLKAISNAFANSWNYTTASSATRHHVSAYIVLSGLSYALTRYSWNAYDNAVKLYQRLIRHNTHDSLFASDIPATTLPENNQEIAAINQENPNLIWVRTYHEIIAPPAYEEPSAPPADDDAPQQMYPAINASRANIQVPMPAAPLAAASSSSEQAELRCPLCPLNINKRDFSANMALRCAHVFHSKCIRPVILNNPDAACPVCKTPIANNNA